MASSLDCCFELIRGEVRVECLVDCKTNSLLFV
jgi:hypothetical protein